MLCLRNPGVATLTGFLENVQRIQPANYSEITAGHGKGYGTTSRYLSYCLNAGLIRVESETRGRGRYTSKTYTLTEKGSALLTILEEGNEPSRALPSSPRARYA